MGLGGRLTLCSPFQVARVKARLERERQDGRAAAQRHSAASAHGEAPSGAKSWSSDEIQLLIKAVNLFPAGTSKR